MPAWILRCLVLTVSTSVPACRAPSIAPQPLVLAVDSTAYHRRGQSPVLVPFTITNGGVSTQYVTQCNGSPAAVIDRLVWGSWSSWEGAFCNGGPSPPLAVPAGRSVQGAVTLYASGHFRLRIGTAISPKASAGQELATPGFDVW